jgi:predicted aspartyl protease
VELRSLMGLSSSCRINEYRALVECGLTGEIPVTLPICPSLNSTRFSAVSCVTAGFLLCVTNVPVITFQEGGGGTDPHILAHVNIVCPDDRYAK